ncbi:MAG: hypothetical protein EOP54_24690 [Sphingobacteriales bacterium]|nr:MAG: hypothetical protein EOP54_24690 [Sphingobacteriales bacterium]
MDFFDEINSFEYLFCTGINELSGNRLQINIEQAVSGTEKENLSFGGVILSDLTPMERGGNKYSIYFSRYLAYHITNESYGTFNNIDEFDGHLIRVYYKSSYLQFIYDTTIADVIYPGDLKHYGILCQDQIVDIITNEVPVITKVGS